MWRLSYLLLLIANHWPVTATPVGQIPLLDSTQQEGLQNSQVHGRFLHISDLHPDPYYEYHSSVAEGDACHRGKGPAGHYGAEGSSCDSPFSLINETFRWVDENLRDSVDFVLWTGDSARHDNDEQFPRKDAEIKETNEFCVSKFMHTFGENGILKIPVVPTFGNNDVLPHNIFYPGPNRWTRAFLDIWRPFIPESQRHGFEYGGWFWVEVLPNKLAVLSVNSLYFADNNAAVDGCADKSQPGYAQFEWLRVQLASLRKRGMKAIIMGHQAPARTESKNSWDETCWQKYTLWTHQYRDVVVGSVWGHMNIDHFMLQDIKDVRPDLISGQSTRNGVSTFDEEITTQGITGYLTELRELWHALPTPPKKLEAAKKKEKEKFFKEIGGPYAERYSLSLVNAAIVPNYFPTLRVIEYNISNHNTPAPNQVESPSTNLPPHLESIPFEQMTIPRGPSKSTPPGPAYSPQTYTWLKYTQYFANLTIANNDFVSTGWKEGKHANEEPRSNPSPNPRALTYKVEYDTAEDKIYNMPDLTVLSYVKLAETIGNARPENELQREIRVDGAKKGTNRGKHKKKKDRKKKKDKRKRANKTWHAFVRRAFIGAIDDAQLEDQFGEVFQEEDS